MPPETNGLYLDLLAKSLRNSIYGESVVEAKINGFLQRVRHPYLTRRGTIVWPGKAHTMLSEKGLANVRYLMERALSDGVSGDFIETGVWRGGTCILMRGVLEAHGIKTRRVFVADSFAGLPKPNPDAYPADKRDKLFQFSELAVSLDQVKENFGKYGLLNEQVVFLEGLFSETLPRLTDEKFAIIRLDGDMYESTMDALTNLYDRLSPGGYCIVDDYGGLRNCRKAVHDFLDSRSLRPTIKPVDDTVVWWQKQPLP